VFEVRQTEYFADWLANLKDDRAARKIAQRILRLQAGLLGDVAPVGGGVSELRIHHGPGYRLYFVKRRRVLIVLLCGGDKGTQDDDIHVAKRLAADLEM
jgi:putative addiction module killer protein